MHLPEKWLILLEQQSIKLQFKSEMAQSTCKEFHQNNRRCNAVSQNNWKAEIINYCLRFNWKGNDSEDYIIAQPGRIHLENLRDANKIMYT